LANHLTQVVNPTGTYGFTFDADGRLTQTSTAYSFITGKTFTVGYGYDAAANRTSMTDPQNAGTTYVYDTLNRLSSLTSPQGAFGFSYDALSRRSQLTRPNNVTTTYGYDPLSRLLSVLHKLGGTTLDGATYTVDNAGNRTSRTPQPSGTATNFGYNNIYELLSAQGGSANENYTYDKVGNRLTSTAGSYGYNTSNELTSSPTATFTYDNNGNTLTKADSTGTTSYSWDFENRLTSVTLPGSGGTVSFKYDPFGRRIQKSSSTSTTIYIYDGDNSLEELDVSGNLVARYTQAQNIDQPLAMLRGSTTSYYQPDALGSVTSLSNAAGTITDTYTFDSFGNPAATIGTTVNPFRYTGREFDTETGLYFYRARYFDPAAGRFLSEDPIGLWGGLNLYRYVKNNPTGYIDPSGMQESSVDAAMQQAIARGDIGEIQAILESAGDELTPGLRQAGQIAVDNGSTTQGGAKSAAELAKHVSNLQKAEDELAALRQQLCKAVRKEARQALQKEIQDLLKAIAGHIKEIAQKWGIG
jgi:RHS repeat-associated protein